MKFVCAVMAVLGALLVVSMATACSPQQLLLQQNVGHCYTQPVIVQQQALAYSQPVIVQRQAVVYSQPIVQKQRIIGGGRSVTRQRVVVRTR